MCSTICALIFVGVNICVFHRSAAIQENFVRENLDILCWKSCWPNQWCHAYKTWRRFICQPDRCMTGSFVPLSPSALFLLVEKHVYLFSLGPQKMVWPLELLLLPRWSWQFRRSWRALRTCRNSWAKRIIDAKEEKPMWQDNQNDLKDKIARYTAPHSYARIFQHPYSYSWLSLTATNLKMRNPWNINPTKIKMHTVCVQCHKCWWIIHVEVANAYLV